MTALSPTSVVGKTWGILSPGERLQLLKLLPAVALVALFETAGVASVAPFLALLSNPEIAHRNPILATAYRLIGFTSDESFFLAVGGCVLVLMTLGNAANAATTWAMLRFAADRNHGLSERLLASYLDEPYTFFLQRNSSDLGKNILNEVGAVTNGVLVQGIVLASRAVVVAGVAVALLISDPLMAVIICVVFGGAYAAIYVAVRRRIVVRGRERNSANEERFKVAQEAFAGIKELKVYGLEKVVVDAFRGPSSRFAHLQAANAVLGQLPRYGIESVAFGGVLTIILIWLRRGDRVTEVLPVLGLYAFAAYRLLPAFQTIFAGFTTLRFNLPALDVLCRDLVTRTSTNRNVGHAQSFEREIAMEHVGYRYDGASRPTLIDVDLRLRRGEWLALVGPTGSGKSTLVDLLLGLLEPTAGRVVVDGSAVPRGAGSSNSHIAYVPQQIFMLDDTVRANICFGVAPDAVDEERLRWAARIAQIDAFVSNDLDGGYGAMIGERGLRLSGGQRQRIGIARALYRRPALLVLDEATSALDHATESAFFDALRRELRGCAVISIAHRLSTTRSFDRIVVLEKGRIVDSGTYDELSVRSNHFRSGSTGGVEAA